MIRLTVAPPWQVAAVFRKPRQQQAGQLFEHFHSPLRKLGINNLLLLIESEPPEYNGPAANELQDHLLSDCQKSLAEFALASAKKMEIIFSGGVYVGENTARLANVRRARPSCAAASRSPFQTRAQ